MQLKNINVFGKGKADTHVHTKYSGFSRYLFMHYPDSISEPDKVVKAAIHRGLNVLCITDHNSIEGALKAQKYTKSLLPNIKSDIEIVIGEEISTSEGEMIGLFLQERIRPGLSAQETTEHIHDQDGIAIAPHPFSPHCPCLGQKVQYLDLDGIEIFNAVHRDPYSNILASRKSIINGKACMGGSDAHIIKDVGNGYTLFSGTTADDLKKSILKKETLFGGDTTTLKDCILWSMFSSFYITKATYRTLRGIFPKEDPLHLRINKIKKRNKILGLIASSFYLIPPIPIVIGLIGEVIIRKKARRLWFETVDNI